MMKYIMNKSVGFSFLSTCLSAGLTTGFVTGLQVFSLATFAPSVALSEVTRSEVVGSSAAKVSTPSANKKQELTPDEVKMGGQESPYPSCSGQLMVESSDYQKNSKYWQAREKSCDSKVASCNLKVQVVPDSGVFASRTVVSGQNVSSSVALGAFLEKVRVRASEELTKKVSHYESLAKNCLSGTKKDSTCEGSVGAIRQRISSNVSSFRAALARMVVPSESDLQRVAATGDVSLLINEELDASRAFAFGPKMSAMTSAEVAAAKKDYQAIIAKARKEHEQEIEELLKPLKVRGRETDLVRQRADLSRPENFTRKLRVALANHRGEQVLKYNEAISKAPELPYIGDAKASDAVMAAGVGLLVKDVKESMTRMSRKPGEKVDLTAKKVDSSLLQYAAYSTLIDKMLTEEMNKGGASSCAIATAGFNQLKTVEGRNAAYLAAATVGTSVAFALAPGAAAMMGSAMTAGAASLSANLAVTAGLVGGVAMTASDVIRASDLAQDSRTGLVEAKDVDEAKSSASIGILLTPLDFMGAGAVVGGAVAVGSKALSRFSAAAVAKGQLKTGAGSSGDVVKLATTAGSAATAAAKAAAQTKLDELGGKAASSLLGRAPAASDEASFEALAKAGALGTPEKPNLVVAQEYAEVTKGMSEAERKQYSADLAKVTDVVAGSSAAKSGEKSAAKSAEVVRDMADAERVREAGLLAIEVAAAAPNKQATAALLAPGSGFDAKALSGVRAVMDSAKKLVSGTGEVVGAKAGVAYRNAIAKLSGKSPSSKEVDQMCICSQLCGVRGVGAVDVEGAATDIASIDLDGRASDLVSDLDVQATDVVANGTDAPLSIRVLNQTPSRSVASLGDDFRADQQQACLAR